jgi:hypothetical protein
LLIWFQPFFWTYNLNFIYVNEGCELIFYIYISKPFEWYKNVKFLQGLLYAFLFQRCERLWNFNSPSDSFLKWFSLENAWDLALLHFPTSVKMHESHNTFSSHSFSCPSFDCELKTKIITQQFRVQRILKFIIIWCKKKLMKVSLNWCIATPKT